jgi:hypothetical protein
MKHETDHNRVKIPIQETFPWGKILARDAEAVQMLQTERSAKRDEEPLRGRQIPARNAELTRRQIEA